MDIVVNMEYIIILIICVLTLIILKFALNIKYKNLKEIKKIGYDPKLNNITNKLPENEIVCRDILKILKNEKVTIETREGKNDKSSFFIVTKNKIIIANIKDTFTRIQTIAHECIHSIQNKRTLMFNYVFSNVYVVYFIIITILTLANIVKKPILHICMLIILGIIYYVVRNFLEMEAMNKAPFVAKIYMEESKKIKEDDISKIMKNYEYLNKMGTPIMSFNLILSVIIKIIIYCIAVFISLI